MINICTKKIENGMTSNMLSHFTDWGVPKFKNYIKHKNGIQENIFRFHTLKARIIIPQKRKVNISCELKKLNDDRIPEMIQRFENGENVDKFLSNGIYELKRQDLLLLNEWNIYHLHFKEERSGDLLFVYITDHEVYFLDIQSHKIKPWADEVFIKIIHNNWSSLLERYRCNINTPARYLTPTEREKSRKYRGALQGEEKRFSRTVFLNPDRVIKVNDEIAYYPPGSGHFPFMGALTDTGGSLRVRVKADQEYNKYLKEKNCLDKIIRNNEIICSELESDPNISINLKLCDKGNNNYSFEDKSLRFKFNINIK